MTISSMTGFARSSGAHGHFTWAWELKSVNGKSFDAKLRLPQGLDHIEPTARTTLMQGFKRGNVQASLSTVGTETEEKIAINEVVLNNYIDLAEKLRARLGGEKLNAEAFLTLKGVFEYAVTPVSEEEQAALDKEILQSLNEAVKALTKARLAEGAQLHKILSAQINRIEELTIAARDNPSRTPETIRARLKDQVTRLLETGASFDQERLHQEAVIIATRADIQEEVDRLIGHVESARDLLQSKEPVGRKLDFLAQEFNREANTLCSKAGDKAMTTIGLELKTTIDQMREQVQNIE
jgi:uncharacterized protein (TIGR00255 family)